MTVPPPGAGNTEREPKARAAVPGLSDEGGHGGSSAPEASAGNTALGDVRVVCLSSLGPVPFAAMLLGDLGAQVIRVDRPGRAGSLTGLPLEDDPRTRGHRGIGIDLRDSAGRAVLLRLAERADMFLEGMRPGAAEKLGIGPGELLEVNPGLVYGRATGWGQSGPRATRPATTSTTPRSPAGVPARPRRRAAAAAAEPARGLRRRRRLPRARAARRAAQRSLTGRGQVVDAAMVDGVASLTTMLHGMLAAGLWTDRAGREPAGRRGAFLPHLPHRGRVLHGRRRP